MQTRGLTIWLLGSLMVCLAFSAPSFSAEKRTAACLAQNLHIDFKYLNDTRFSGRKMRNRYIKKLRKELTKTFTLVDSVDDMDGEDVSINIRLELLSSRWSDYESQLNLYVGLDVLNAQNHKLWGDEFNGIKGMSIGARLYLEDSPKATAKLTAKNIVQACNNQWLDGVGSA